MTISRKKWSEKDQRRISRLIHEISMLLDREMVIVLKNPYKEFNDIVEAVAIWRDYRENLHPYREVYIMTDESIEKKIGAAEKYVWYDRRWTRSFMAWLILEDILKHNKNNLRIISKVKYYYLEAVERLRIDSKVLDKIEKNKIFKMSN